MWLNVRNSRGPVGGRSLEQGELTIGRDLAAGLPITDERASRRHARLMAWPGGQLQVEDLGSTNGTWVNGTRIAGPTFLHVGDEIGVGAHLIRLSDRPEGPAGPGGQQQGPAGPGGQQQGPAGPARAWMPPPVFPAPAPAPAPPGPPLAQPGWTPAPSPPLPVAPSPVGWPSSASPAAPTPAQQPPWPGAGLAAPGGPMGPPTATFPPSTPTTGSKRRKGPWIAGGVGALVVIAVVVALVTQLGGGGTMTAGQVSSAWGPSTLYILVSDHGQPQDSGSAWVYDASEGLIVTNAHVVDGGTSYSVGQGPKKQKATLVAVAPCQDLAVLKVADTKSLRTFHLGSQAGTHGGDPVTALGYPAGSTQAPSLATTTGVVSIVSTRFDQPGSVDTPNYPNVLQTTAPINPGNSGGPLLNNKGELIGVNTAGLNQDQNGQTIQNEGFAIGVDQARRVLTGLSQGRSVGFTGMDLYFPTGGSDFANFSVPEVDKGVIVPDAQPGSPAARAGFGKDGNAAIITAIDGRQLDGNLVSYCKAVGDKATGQSASFHVVLSNGGQADVTVPFK